MMILLMVFVVLLTSNCYLSDKTENDENKKIIKDVYMGESFPAKYLQVEPVKPEALDRFLAIIPRALKYFASNVNQTDVNTSLGGYLIPALLRNLLLYHGEKIGNELKIKFKKIINKSYDVLSHYTYRHLGKEWTDLERRVSELFKDDYGIVHSVGDYQSGRLIKWIRSAVAVHGFVRELDDASMDKFMYTGLTAAMDDYFLTIDDSDECLSRLGFMRPVLDPTGDLERCKPDKFCDEVVQKGPSIAYALSHRQFNIMIRHLSKRCYITTLHEDKQHLDLLCSSMYREAVYIARRGFFARDMFVEHIVLCGLLGYEEFLRDSWLQKVSSWFDKYGCLTENLNYDMNITKYHISRAGNDLKRIKRSRERLQRVRKQKCHHHPMILATIALTLGVHNVVHHMPPVITSPVS